MPFSIALDGPSGAGKGLIGKKIAEIFSLQYVQSSLVYRALAFTCIENRILPENEEAVTRIALEQKIMDLAFSVDLNNELIAAVASKIATIESVRKNLTAYLTKTMNSASRIIMEGRDIGTVVAPKADLKIFLTANVEVRSKRRYKQLLTLGKECIFENVLKELKERDARDSERSLAPLRQAKDAFVIDSSDLSPDQVIEAVKNLLTN